MSFSNLIRRRIGNRKVTARLLFFGLQVFFLCAVNAQSGSDFTIIALENTHQISSIELSPDNTTMAIGTAGGPIILWDVATQKEIRRIPVNGYPWGPYMHYSSDGNYLLLIQQFFTDFALNKDRPSRVEVLELSSGKILFSQSGVNSATFGMDDKTIVGLKGGEVVFWNILSGEQEKKFNPGQATNSVALSRAAKVIAVSQKPSEADLKTIPSIRSDKKAMKEALKFREVVVFYDVQTLKQTAVINDIFDIVFSMRFSDDGTSLFLFNAPHTRFRAQQGAERNAYIQTVNVADAASSRVIFPTNATEPLYKESKDKNYFAAASIEPRFRILHSINLFDRERGAMLKNFVLDFRVGEDVHTGRASFEFLPDHTKMLVGYGSRLALWKIQ